MPSDLARAATFGSAMSRTLTSQDGQLICLTRLIVSLQTEQPALNTSTFRVAIPNLQWFRYTFLAGWSRFSGGITPNKRCHKDRDSKPGDWVRFELELTE
jgi:hypothetical protein